MRMMASVSAAVVVLMCTGAVRAQTGTVTQLQFDSRINGDAVRVTAGQVTTVTTSNGPCNYSSLAWSRFNIGAGDTVNFVQPSGTSVSINRVIDSNPSTIAGTLTSNGRLILVNPFGITISAGAVVDTAGFTAATIPHTSATDAELLAAGFGTGTLVGPALPIDVQGQIVARSGDVVLVGSNLTLRGSIDAMGTALEGGRVVLRALDTLKVEVGSQVLARQGTATQGGQIELLGSQVTLESGTSLRAGSIAITADGTASASAITFQGAEVMADQGPLTVTADTATLDGVNRLWGSAGTSFSSATLPAGIGVTLGADSTLQTTGLSASGVAQPGTLTINGGLTVGPRATLRMAVGNGASDRIVLSGGAADFTDPGTNTLNLSLLPGTDSLAAGRYTLIEGTTRTGQPPAAPSGSTPTPARAGAALPERTTLSWGSLVLVVPTPDNTGSGSSGGGGGASSNDGTLSVLQGAGGNTNNTDDNKSDDSPDLVEDDC